ncbi:hypothetical protein Tco_0470939 [Tanacetum coccineum]
MYYLGLEEVLIVDGVFDGAFWRSWVLKKSICGIHGRFWLRKMKDDKKIKKSHDLREEVDSRGKAWGLKL